jgi:hypothetical protein
MMKITKVKPASKQITLNESACLSLSPAFLLKLRRRLQRAIKKEVAKSTANNTG